MANISALPDKDWDRTLIELDGHVLQSSAWLRVQRALGYEVLWARADGWQWAGAVRSGAFPRYLYVPYGPASRWRTEASLRDATHAASAVGLDFVRVEPTGTDARPALDALGARAVRPVQPRCTWELDVTTDLETLRRGMASGHRSSINAASRRGVSVRSTSDPAEIEIFIRLQSHAAGRSSFRGQPARYHAAVASVMMPLGMARLYVAEAGGEPIAASICFDFAGTRYYAHAASDPEGGRRLGTGPPLLWQMILDARDRGATRFDFWGVLCEDSADHPWAGFSRFKKAFGGRMLQRAGTWEIPVRRLRHRAFTALRRLR